jgi:cyclohexa-1,5-dienecarbonyl-CoA hydratase
MSAESSIRLESLEQGAVWRVVLATPKANILDMEKSEQLLSIFTRAQKEKSLKAILIEGEGPHFSFGASVEEHRPDTCAAMLHGFHRLFRVILDTAVPTFAAVRGQCLGGALELVSFCNRVIAAPDARLGQPEIVLGVFAPVASVALVERVGRGLAEDLCLSGRSITAEAALAAGLVDQIADDPSAAAMDYIREHLLPKSASSLRLALRAVRYGFARRFNEEIEAVEKLYLDELMSTADAEEGLAAFIGKRKPVWSDA